MPADSATHVLVTEHASLRKRISSVSRSGGGVGFWGGPGKYFFSPCSLSFQNPKTYFFNYITNDDEQG